MIDIILIGGSSGSGKSSISKEISNSFCFHHRIGSGFVRQIVREFIDNEKNPYLHSYSFDNTLDKMGYDLLIAQSKPLVKPIKSCIERARKEGTKLVVEGVNIIPSLYNEVDADLKIILNNKNETKHFQMIMGESHSKRIISKNEFKIIRKIQESFLKDALENKWHILNTDCAFGKISELIDLK